MPDAVASYVPSTTVDLKHTNPTGTSESLSTLLNNTLTHVGPRLMNWFRGGISGKKICIVGDSTSDNTGNAVGMYTELSNYQAPGDALAGVTLADFGTNGQTGAAFLSGRGSGTATGTSTASAVGTTTTIVTASVTGIGVSTNLTAATGTAGNIGQTRAVTAITGTGPFTLTVSPAFTSATASADTFTFPNKNWTSLLAAAPDLIILSYGINDVRLGATTQTQLTTTITSIVNLLRTDLPNCDIVLRIPNALSQDNAGGTNNFVTTSGAVIVDQATNANGSVAQDYSDRMYFAYKSLENKWPNVVLLDVQMAISGRTAPLTAVAGNMTDQLHPGPQNYTNIARSLVALAGVPNPVNIAAKNGNIPNTYSQAQADRAYAVASANTGTAWTPWVTYPRVLEDPNQFEFVAEGRLNGAPSATTFTMAGGPGNFNNGYNASKILAGDIFLFYDDSSVWVTSSATGLNPASSGTAATTSSINVSYTSGQGPTTTSTKGLVRVFRRKYQGDATVAYYAQSAGTYPSMWRAKVVAAGIGFLQLQTAEPGAIPHYAHLIRAGDIIIAPGQTPYTVQASGDSISYAAGYPQLSGSATTFTAWAGLTNVYVVSTRQPDTNLKGQEVLKFNTTPGSVLVVSATSVTKQIAARPGRYNTVFAKLGTAGTGGNTIATISVNGTVQLTLTFATASTAATLTWTTPSVFYVTPNDVLSVQITTVTGSPADLTISLDNN
jgi:lysophospholipase L1-like esterase